MGRPGVHRWRVWWDTMLRVSSARWGGLLMVTIDYHMSTYSESVWHYHPFLLLALNIYLFWHLPSYFVMGVNFSKLGKSNFQEWRTKLLTKHIVTKCFRSCSSCGGDGCSEWIWEDIQGLSVQGALPCHCLLPSRLHLRRPRPVLRHHPAPAHLQWHWPRLLLRWLQSSVTRPWTCVTNTDETHPHFYCDNSTAFTTRWLFFQILEKHSRL